MYMSAAYGAKSFTSTVGWIDFYAGGTLDYNGPSITTTSADQGFALIAGKTVNVNNAISDSEVGIAAGLTRAQWTSIDNVNITSAQQMLSYLGTGGTININANVTATKEVAMLANDININGSQVRANNSTGKTYLAAGNNIKLSNGALVYGGDDVYLALAGSTSTIYLNEFTGQSASKIHAGSPNTVNLYFAGRSSGGIVLDGLASNLTTAGKSGFYVGATAVPATLGNGLLITYAAPIQVDPITTNLSGAVDKVDSTTTPTEDPTSPTTETAETTETATWTTATGETILLSSYTTGGTEETFGATSTPGVTITSTEEEKTAATEEPPPASPGKGRSAGEKKVAQCSS
jgi:hypothetical protein